MDIVYVEIRADMRTGEALRAGYAMLENPDYILVTNGDTYIPDLLLRDFYEYHTSQKADCSIVLKYIRTNIEKFGNVTINGNRVEEFIEKPKSADLYKYLTNSGWYLFSYPFYQSLSYHGEHMETDLFPTLPQKWNTLAYIYSKPWYHVQSLAEYEQANGYV
jgi:NDP-sugar pyrophosphorylase family protein